MVMLPFILLHSALILTQMISAILFKSSFLTASVLHFIFMVESGTDCLQYAMEPNWQKMLSLLWCDAVSLGEQFSTFGRI